MTAEFKAAAAPISEAERLLKELCIKHHVLAGGRVVVDGDLDISDCGLKELPDLSGVEVNGDFNCSRNQLSSLKGAPMLIRGSFTCSYNLLETLEGAPESVGKNFRCNNNMLKSLKGAPQDVGKHFDCSHNELENLDGGPARVHGDYSCTHNALTSASGCGAVNGGFICENNPHLKSLEGVPPDCEFYISNFGNFMSWGEFPEDVRESRATKERRAAEADEAIHRATVLQAPVGIGRPLRFKGR